MRYYFISSAPPTLRSLEKYGVRGDPSRRQSLELIRRVLFPVRLECHLNPMLSPVPRSGEQDAAWYWRGGGYHEAFGRKDPPPFCCPLSAFPFSLFPFLTHTHRRRGPFAPRPVGSLSSCEELPGNERAAHIFRAMQPAQARSRGPNKKNRGRPSHVALDAASTVTCLVLPVTI